MSRQGVCPRTLDVAELVVRPHLARPVSQTLGHQTPPVVNPLIIAHMYYFASPLYFWLKRALFGLFIVDPAIYPQIDILRMKSANWRIISLVRKEYFQNFKLPLYVGIRTEQQFIAIGGEGAEVADEFIRNCEFVYKDVHFFQPLRYQHNIIQQFAI